MIQGCKKADKVEALPTEVPENIVTEKDTYKLYEIVVVFCKHKLQPDSKIEGKVGSSSLQIGVANDSTLVFVVMPNVFQIGDNKMTFSVNGKNVNVSVKVTSSTLVPSPAEEINSFTATQQTQITSLENMIANDTQLVKNPDIANAISRAKSLATNFKADFDKLNADDQLVVANFIASNKSTFEKINTDINIILSSLTSSNNGLLRRSAFCADGTPVERYKCHWEYLGDKLIDVAITGTLAYLAFTTIPVTGLFGLGVGAVAAALTAPSMVAIVSVSGKLIYIHFKIAYLLVAGVIKDGQLRTTNTPTIFENGVSTSLPIKIRLRNVQAEDNGTALNWLKTGMVLVNKYNSFCDKLKLSEFKFLFGGLRTLEASPFKLSHISIKNISNSKVVPAGLEGTVAAPKIKFTTNETSEQLFNFDLTYNDGVNLPVTITIPSKLKTGGCSFNSITDPRDGEIYKIVQIGDQTWFAENLRYSVNVQNIKIDSLWDKDSSGAWCYYNNDASKNIPFGKLYNWYAIKNRNVCPSGWHVSNNTDLSTLINYLDPNADGGNNLNTAGGQMKSTGTQYWKNPNVNATNSSCFSGLPGGARILGSIGFINMGDFGYWWSSSESTLTQAWYFGLFSSDGDVGKDTNNKHIGYSVRCVKN